MKKCDEAGMCKFLAERCDASPIGKGKGFFAVNTVNLKDPVPQEKFRGVAYRMGRKDRGMMLNFCPFCGGRPGSIFEAELNLQEVKEV